MFVYSKFKNVINSRFKIVSGKVLNLFDFQWNCNVVAFVIAGIVNL